MEKGRTTTIAHIPGATASAARSVFERRRRLSEVKLRLHDRKWSEDASERHDYETHGAGYCGTDFAVKCAQKNGGNGGGDGSELRTRWSFVVLQYRMRLALASLTRMRGRARSSRRRWLCSSSRRSLSSDMDCFGREDILDDVEGWECGTR